MQYIFILGNTPELSVLEIKSILPDFSVLHETEQIFMIETQQDINAQELIKILGGTVKIALLIPPTPFSTFVETGEQRGLRTKFGFSFYSLDKSIGVSYLKNLKQKYRRKGLELKKELRAQGKRAELIESQDLALSSVIIAKEKCMDIIILVDENKKEYYAKTLAVQPFREFSHRDYDRPNKDMHAGMLPPKVARMMVNISQGKKDEILLDPFCGSGTILQEALLLGYQKVIGSDISAKAIKDSEANLKFLNLKNYKLLNIDAKNLKNMKISMIITEVYLGPPNIIPQKLNNAINELLKLYQEVFLNLKKILNKNANLVVAFPAWRFNNQITHLPITEILNKLGYKQKSQPIIYGRPDARVLREIYILNLTRPPA